MVDALYLDAGMDAHFAALKRLIVKLDRKPTALETATALAVAYGDALGLAAMNGAGAERLEELADVVISRCNLTVSLIAHEQCAGSA